MPIRKWGLVSLSHCYVRPSSQDGQVKQVMALDRLSLSQPFGEIVGLIGGKGAGKQTLMKILIGEIKPTEGLVSGGPDTAGCLEFPEQGSKERTGEGYAQRKLRKWQVSKKKIPELLAEIRDFSELGSRFSKKMKYYSLEEKIQLEISILLHVAPSLIYIDESLLAVKEHFYIKVFFYLLKLKELGSSIWIKTENIRRIEGYCDKLLWLEFGRLQKHGEVKDVLRSYDHYYQQIDGLSYKEQKLFWEQGYHEQLLGTKAGGKKQESLKLANGGKERPEKKQSLNSNHEEVITRAVSRRRKKQEIKPKKIIWLITIGGIVMILGISTFFAIRTPIFNGRQRTLPVTKMDNEVTNQTTTSTSTSELLETSTEDIKTVPDDQSKTYVVKAGDTLSQLAEKLRISVQQLKEWNQLISDEITLGQELNVTPSQEKSRENRIATANFNHLVVAGDSLLAIAEKYGITVAELQVVNQLSDLTIYSGTELLLPVTAKVVVDNPPPEQINQTNQTARDQPASTTKQHAVTPGETLYGIAKHYGIDVMEIQRINSLQTEQLDPGQLLIIP